MEKKRIAFIFALPIRTHPALITMPFGLNIVTLLDRRGYHIDVFLTEYESESYKGLFSENVQFHFLDHNYYWPKEGALSYYFLTNYFKYLSTTKLRNKYSHIFASGMAGITLGRILQRRNRKATYIYLNDEFPIQGPLDIWTRGEIRNCKKADFVSTPDESRYAPLCDQVPEIAKIPHYTLPNTPLMDEVSDIPDVNWYEYFDLPKDKKLFLMAGGFQEFNLITELLTSVAKWPENTMLIMKGKNDIAGFRESYAHLDDPDKIFWTTEQLSPDMLHSLIRYCTASMCLYREINTNLTYVGKSSGKLMRSLLLGKPIIASNSHTFDFVTELNIGKVIETPDDIAEAVRYVLDNEAELQGNCRNNYTQISFEKYWAEFEKVLEL